MEKKIQDYLHLYLGCVMEKSDESGQFILTPHSFSQMLLPGTSEYIKQARPLLRPLSSMTGEEVLTAFHMSYEDAGYKFETYSTENFGWRARNQNGMECYMPKNTFLPEVTRYLLSRGFDLFDLIHSGLAIDKTLQSHP